LFLMIFLLISRDQVSASGSR